MIEGKFVDLYARNSGIRDKLIAERDVVLTYALNPIAFAVEHGLPEPEAIDLFLHAAHVGLFQMEWHLLCPNCAQYVQSLDSLRGGRDRARCIT